MEHCWYPLLKAVLIAVAVTQAEEGTVPAKVTVILLGMSGFDLSSPAILLEPETVNSNYTLHSWLMPLYSLHTSL